MITSGITWRGGPLDDVALLSTLPSELVRVLNDTNGFILHGGAFHLRGATHVPAWHSLRAAWQGEAALCKLYESVEATDIPFGQDQVGDQFLLRDGRVRRLAAETGTVEPLANSLEEFFERVDEDITEFLNVELAHVMQPGEVLLAYPPFCCQESGDGASLAPVSANEAILFHANLANQIRDVPDGEKIIFKFVD